MIILSKGWTSPNLIPQTNTSSGIPLVRNLRNPPLPAPHPPSPRRPRPNLEHRILQRTRLLQTPNQLGEDPPNPHPRLRRLASALPEREVARRFSKPGQQFAVEIADSGRWAAVCYAVGRGDGGVDGLVDEGGALG